MAVENEGLVEVNIRLVNPEWRKDDPRRWDRAVELVSTEQDVVRVQPGAYVKVFFRAPRSAMTRDFLIQQKKRFSDLAASAR